MIILAFAWFGTGVAAARNLAGRVFLGKGLQLYLQEDESILTNVLRSIRLISSDVPVLNISALSVSPDMVFIGEDRKLYFRDVHGDGKTYAIGQLGDLSDASLRRGVRFYEQRQALDAFEGRHKGRLAVRCNSRPAAEDETPRPADMQFWLDELQREYDARFTSELHRNNAILILNALPDALPADGKGDASLYENLKLLTSWVREGSFEYVKPLQALVRTLLQRVKHRLVEGGGQRGDGSDEARLLGMYEDLASRLDDLE